jgi:hypothetical protein
MELKGSLTYSQEPATGPYPEQNNNSGSRNILVSVHEVWGMPQLPNVAQYVGAQWSFLLIVENWFKVWFVISLLILNT